MVIFKALPRLRVRVTVVTLLPRLMRSKGRAYNVINNALHWILDVLTKIFPLMMSFKVLLRAVFRTLRSRGAARLARTARSAKMSRSAKIFARVLSIAAPWAEAVNPRRRNVEKCMLFECC